MCRRDGQPLRARRIARHSEPASEQAGIVTVRCSSAVWAAELTMMSRQLLERLNEARTPDRQVREIRFVVGGRET